MASNTKNLDLLMKNPSTDGADTFNVQTMLNENWQKIDNNAGTVAKTLANILKPTTPPIIGLPPSTTPDGMFQALGNTGDLHVWRKTVVVKEPVPEVPGSYTLGSAAITSLARMTSNGYNGYAANILVSKEIKVNLDGSVELVSPTSRQMIVSGSSESYTIDVNSDDLLGAGNRYFTPSKDSNLNSSRCTLLIPPGTVYYVAPGTTYATAERSIGFTSAFNAAQLVTGVPGTPAIPAGTTTTYPVSTNPKAYQEGDDAKPAGYVLEASKQMIAFKTTNSSYKYYAYNYAESISVSDDGTVSLVGALKASGRPFQTDSFNAAKGKFCQFIIEDWFDGYVSTEITGIVFIPSDAVFDVTTLQVTCSNVQPVTGYAAIPAGTTIEYLGKLGDKPRVQVVSYVGTGTYGKDNPCSITVDFKINTILFLSFLGNNGKMLINNYATRAMIGDVLTTEYVASRGFSDQNSSYPTYGKKSADGKTFSWYHEYNSSYQCNNSGFKYYYLVISN